MQRRLARRIGLVFSTMVFGLATVVFSMFVWFNLPVHRVRDTAAHLGITYSDRYAEALGLDSRAAYLAMLDNLHARRVRLPVYWDRIESAPDKYNFSDLDWQIEQAAARHVELILVVGQRVPRWPECFIPAWYQSDTSARQAALLNFIQATVERYRDQSAVRVWQVENEAFLDQRFGICPPLDVAFLDREITLVRATDRGVRPILITDSGEISWWVQAASRGDIFGTTLYRDLWHPRFGYLSYPISPNFFLAKKWLIHVLAHQDHVIVAELQAEPWARGWVADVPLEEQYRTMNPALLVADVDYARQFGTSDIYLWGAEWWYWLKEQKNAPEIWNTAKTLFAEEGER